ncbi:hypothetical protein NECAME_14971 [Necator americanus]|uniref:Reverse transcriptase domain-containing protein n=1 Tax=Necator americanus TaxID=51031 RepID=W2SKQ0_NECAM|nr:hypothetical protein NECAME_14971 [Necator americanus]ETN70133.1 hypothetical protein NECAME_14971 [Necator americanus]
MDKIVWDRFNGTIERRVDGYYVTLPWKDQYPHLPDNKAIAYRRLVSVWNSPSKDEQLLDRYNSVFKDQLHQKIIEIVQEGDPVQGNHVHYIPHQPVLTSQKTTMKVRIVFDALAHYKGSPSLNDVLYIGPVILPPLYGLLLLFRIGKIAVIADVEKAFLQVRLHEKDRDATRCLWLHNHKFPPSPANVQTLRFTRVTFGIKSSPFLLTRTMYYHLKSYKTESDIVQELKDNLYVDNLILTTDSIDRAIHLYKRSKQMFQDLNMNLR